MSPPIDTARVLDLLRPAVRAMRPYVPGEQVRDCLKLNTNECAWPPSPAVRAAIAGLGVDELRLYPSPPAEALRRAAAAHYGLAPEQILVGNGSDDCLTILYRAFLDTRSHTSVAVPWPTYGLYDTCAAIQDVDMQHHAVDLDGPQAWGLPASLFGCDARLVLVANPNNPSSTLVHPEQLQELADSLADGILVVDEAYIDFVDPRLDASMLKALDRHPNLVVLRTFSKSYSLAGARVGLLLAHPELVAQLMKVKDSYNVDAIAQAAACAALQDDEHHRRMIADTVAARSELSDRLAAFGWSWPPAQGNFLLCTVGERAGDLYRGLKQQGILVRWWDTPHLRDKLRITVGRPEENRRLLGALRGLLA